MKKTNHQRTESKLQSLLHRDSSSSSKISNQVISCMKSKKQQRILRQLDPVKKDFMEETIVPQFYEQNFEKTIGKTTALGENEQKFTQLPICTSIVKVTQQKDLRQNQNSMKRALSLYFSKQADQCTVLAQTILNPITLPSESEQKLDTSSDKKDQYCTNTFKSLERHTFLENDDESVILHDASSCVQFDKAETSTAQKLEQDLSQIPATFQSVSNDLLLDFTKPSLNDRTKEILLACVKGRRCRLVFRILYHKTFGLQKKKHVNFRELFEKAMDEQMYLESKMETLLTLEVSTKKIKTEVPEIMVEAVRTPVEQLEIDPYSGEISVRLTPRDTKPHSLFPQKENKHRFKPTSTCSFYEQTQICNISITKPLPKLGSKKKRALSNTTKLPHKLSQTSLKPLHKPKKILLQPKTPLEVYEDTLSMRRQLLTRQIKRLPKSTNCSTTLVSMNQTRATTPRLKHHKHFSGLSTIQQSRKDDSYFSLNNRKDASKGTSKFMQTSTASLNKDKPQKPVSSLQLMRDAIASVTQAKHLR